MPQIQHFHDFIFEDYWADFANDYASKNEFQGLNFRAMHVIHENSEIYVSCTSMVVIVMAHAKSRD